ETATIFMNSRRLIVAPEAKVRQSYRQRPVHRKGSSMSALGQKQTFALHKPMSALPPKATLNAFIRMSAYRRADLLNLLRVLIRRCRSQTGPNIHVAAVRRATKTIPIVMVFTSDPIGAGFVASLARPGGNVTGLAADASPELWAKYLALL